MASTAALELLVQLDSKKASAGLDDLAEKGGGLADILKTGMKIAGGAVLGFSAILIGATKAAADEEVGIDRLNRSIKNSVKGWDGNTEAVEAYVTAQTKLAFADDQIRESLNLLVTQTGDLTEAQELQTTAMDLARFGNIDLEKATRLLLKADDESYAALGKLGIQIDENATKEQALQAIRSATAGQAEGYATSVAGSFERIQLAAGDAFETIGAAILPMVEGPMMAFADWLQSDAVQNGITNLATAVGTFLTNAFNTLKSVLDVIVPIIQPFVQSFADFFTRLGEGVPIMDSFGLLFSDLGLAISNAWATIGPALGTLATNVWTWITDTKDGLPARLGEWIPAFWSWITSPTGVVATSLTELGKIATNVWNWITDTKDGLPAQIGTWVTAFWTWVTDPTGVVATSGTELGKIATNLWTWITDTKDGLPAQIGTWVTAFWSWITDPNGIVATAATELGKIATSLWTWVTDKERDWPTQIGTWVTAFWSWITDPEGVVATAAVELAKILVAIGNWIGTTAKTISTQLVDEWIPAFFSWITGDAEGGGAVGKTDENMDKLGTEMWAWITRTAKDIFIEVQKIGGAIADGIWQGFLNNWDEVLAQLGGAVSWGAVNHMTTEIEKKSPSHLFAREIGAPIAEGIGMGFGDAWPGVTSEMVAALTTAGPAMFEAAKKLCDEDILAPIKKLCDEDIPAQIKKLTDDDGVIAGPIRKLADSDTIVAAIKNLCDEDILAPIKKLCDVDIPAVLTDEEAGIRTVGSGVADAVRAGFEGTWPGAAEAMLTMISNTFNALWGEASKRAQEIYDMMTNAHDTGYAGGDPAGGGSGSGGGAGGQVELARGGIVMRPTRALIGEGGPEAVIPLSRLGGGGGGGISISIGAINAGMGADGRRIADELIEELEYRLGDQIAIRRGTRML